MRLGLTGNRMVRSAAKQHKVLSIILATKLGQQGVEGIEIQCAPLQFAEHPRNRCGGKWLAGMNSGSQRGGPNGSRNPAPRQSKAP
jgi:hypothetical protein